MAALVRTFRVKGINDPKTPVSIFSFQYQEENLVVRMIHSDRNWMPNSIYLFGQPHKEFYRGSGLDQTFFVTIQKKDSTRVGHILEYTTSAGEHTIDLELVDAIDDEWPLSETPLVPQGEDPAFPNTKVPRRQFYPVELSVTVGGLEPEEPATFYSQDLGGRPAGRNYTIFNEGRWDHFHEPYESIVWVRASKDGKDFVGNIVLPAGSSRVALDFDPETGDMTADVELFPPSQSPLQEFRGSIRRVAPGYKAPKVYTLEFQITKEGVPTPSAMKSAYVYRSQQDTAPAAIYQILNGFNEKQYFSEAIIGDWFVQAMDEEPPRIGSLRWPTISQQDTVLRFDLSESQQVRPDPGIGILSGSFPLALLTDKDSAPSRAVVRVLYRPEEGHPGDGVLITSTTCNADGTWQVAGLNENEKFDVVARIPGYNDVIISNVQPTDAPFTAHFANLKEEYKYGEETNIQVVALGGRPPYTFTAVELPEGLDIDQSTGIISGSVNTTMNLSFQIKVNDSLDEIAVSGESFAAGDPHWDKVVALLRFDGDFVDETGRLWTVVGSPTFVDDGEHHQAVLSQSNYVHSDILLGDEPFTLEFFSTMTSNTSHGYSQPILQWGTSRDATDGFDIEYSLGQYSGIIYRTAYSYLPRISPSEGWTKDNDMERNHVAVVYDGVSVVCYVNGIGVPVNNFNNMGTTRRLSVGWGNGSWYQNRDKIIDELRITKGVARYTENFDPPTEPFQNY